MKALQDKSSLGYTVRNTESTFSVCWDFMQVRAHACRALRPWCSTSSHYITTLHNARAFQVVLLSYVSVSVPYQTGKFATHAALALGSDACQ